MKKKPPFRWDKLIAMITIGTIIVFAFIIYNDMHPDHNVVEASNDVQPSTLYEEEVATDPNQITVCIDPGHGGTDGGAEVGGTLEKDQVLLVAEATKEYLEQNDIRVILTRTDDSTVSLEKRTRLCNESGAVAMVSIHRNYYIKDKSVKGIEAWIHSSKPSNSAQLADNILSALKTVPAVTNRGIKYGTMESEKTNYYINSHSSCASCIVELGFMTNTSDTQLVTTNKDKTAKAIADGIMKYIEKMRNTNG
jgi:N-acetylmuramoyl-L-alanine amidase